MESSSAYVKSSPAGRFREHVLQQCPAVPERITDTVLLEDRLLEFSAGQSVISRPLIEYFTQLRIRQQGRASVLRLPALGRFVRARNSRIRTPESLGAAQPSANRWLGDIEFLRNVSLREALASHPDGCVATARKVGVSRRRGFHGRSSSASEHTGKRVATFEQARAADIRLEAFDIFMPT
jgi:hypothetical protein